MKDTKDTVLIEQIPLGPMQNFVYLVGCPRTKEAAVVDPAWNVSAIVDAAKKDGMTIKHILLTHSHFDHTNGVEERAAKTHAAVYANKNEIPFLSFRGIRVQPLEDGQTLSLGDVSIRCIHTPGHTPGSQCFVIQNHLISGDTLFINACGRTDLPGGSAGQLAESLCGKLKRLDDGMVLLPGHDYGDVPQTTLGQQKKENPYMQGKSTEDF